jgi:hypothetical protein
LRFAELLCFFSNIPLCAEPDFAKSLIRKGNASHRTRLRKGFAGANPKARAPTSAAAVARDSMLLSDATLRPAGDVVRQFERPAWR